MKLFSYVMVLCLSLIAVTTNATDEKKDKLEPAALVEAVTTYNKAWSAEDYEKMLTFENWEGGEELKGFHYLQEFDPRFGMIEPRVTKIEEKENGEYLVLVLVKHNPPAQFLAQMPNKNMKVRSTLRQYWKKQEDGSFQHLFHVEKQRMLDIMKRQGLTPTPKQPEKDAEPKPAEKTAQPS